MSAPNQNGRVRTGTSSGLFPGGVRLSTVITTGFRQNEGRFRGFDIGGWRLLNVAELAIQTVQVGRRIERRLVALHLPDHFPQAVHDVMLRVHGVAIALEQTL